MRKKHSIKEALAYAQELGYKYCEIPHSELMVGDIIEIGLNKWEVKSVSIENGKTEVSYKLVGEYHRTDDEFWHNVHATKQEKWEQSKVYIEEWKNRTAE